MFEFEFIPFVTYVITGLWNQGTFWGYFGAVVLLLAFLAIAVALGTIIVAIVGWVIGRLVWHFNKRHCSHCGDWTVDKSKGEYTECAFGQSCCASCTFQHFMDQEPHVNCPKCGLMMEKRNVRNRLAIDVCTKHGVWLDLDELETLEGDARQDGYSVGHSNGLAVGIIIS